LSALIPHAHEVRSGGVACHVEGVGRAAGDALRLQAFAEQVADLHLERAVVIGFEADPVGSRVGEKPDAESGQFGFFQLRCNEEKNLVEPLTEPQRALDEGFHRRFAERPMEAAESGVLLKIAGSGGYVALNTLALTGV